ncbi:MAG: hypothetical protein WCJ01_01930 [Ignavibacteria bacterium]
MVKVKTAIYIFLFIFTARLMGQSVLVKATVDSSRYQIGDFINYKITVTSDKSVSLSAPAIKDSLRGIDLLNTETPVSEEKDNTVTTIYKFVLAKYDSGDVRIPPVSVMYNSKLDTVRRSALTNEIRFLVSSLSIKPGSEIKDIKDPLKVPIDWLEISLWVLAAFLILVAAYYAYRYYKKKKALKAGVIEVVRKEPHEEALDALKTLEDKKLWQSGGIKEYHSEITEIIRRYFEERFNLPALEITTDELLSGLRKYRETLKVADITLAFLTNADLVKFAKFVPMNDINEEMMRQAVAIVTMTIPVKAEEAARNV